MYQLKGTIAAFIAVITCPCHLLLTLPILLSLTAGTAFGAWMANNSSWVYGLSLVLFLSSLFLAYRWLATDTEKACEIAKDPLKS